MESSERRNVNSLLFYYIYMETLIIPLVSTKRVVSLTHDCLSVVCTCELSQPIVTAGSDSYHRVTSGRKSRLSSYHLVISKDCIYVTIIKYMYFYNDYEIHFSLTMTASFIG